MILQDGAKSATEAAANGTPHLAHRAPQKKCKVDEPGVGWRLLFAKTVFR